MRLPFYFALKLFSQLRKTNVARFAGKGKKDDLYCTSVTAMLDLKTKHLNYPMRLFFKEMPVKKGALLTSPKQNLPKARVQVKHPYLALMGLYLGAFTGMYSETALNIALPQLSMAFAIDLSLTQWLVVGYMLVIGIVLPFSSLLLKWVSARKLTLFALGAFFIGSLISGIAPTFEIALGGRLIQGIGTGLVLPTMFAMVMEVIPPHKIGSAMGVSALVIMFAPAIGPTLAGFLIAAASWRLIFFSFALILFVAMVFTFKFEVNPYELTKPSIDVASALLSCLGFGGIVLGAGIASLYGWISAPTLLALIVGILCLALYTKRQLGMKIPVLDLHAFGIQGFRVGAICMMLNFGITLSAMYILPQFYQNGMLLAVAFTGIVMLPGGIINALVSMFAGKLFDRIGARIPALVGFALSIIGAALLLFVTPDSSLAYVIACHIIMMIGVPLAMSPCQTHALSSLPHNLSTDGSTILNTLQQVLGAICTAAATSLLATGQSAYFTAGGTDSALAFTQGSHYGFLFTLALAIVGFLFALGIKNRKASGAAPMQSSKKGEISGNAAHPSAMNAPAAATSASVDGSTPTMAASASADGSTPTMAASASAENNNANSHFDPMPLDSQSAQSLLAQLMKTEVYTLPETATALEALALFSEKGISGAPVVNEKGKVTGFVSDGDIIGTLSKQNPTFTSFYAVAYDNGADSQLDEKLSALRTMTVDQLSTKTVLSVDINDDMRDVCTLLSAHHLKKVPVLDEGTMVGIINRSDITHYAVRFYAEKLPSN